ncbi:MAG: hypothetical protein V4485_03100 [Pseudomonadota bacterium]
MNDTDRAAEIIRHEEGVVSFAKKDGAKDETKDLVSPSMDGEKLEKKAGVQHPDVQKDIQNTPSSEQTPSEAISATPQATSPEIPKFGFRDKLIKAAIAVTMIGITVASIATGVAAPLGIVIPVLDKMFEVRHVFASMPHLKKFAESKVGKVLTAAKNILLSRVARRIFKLTIPILALAGVGVATGGIAPAIALTITAVNMAYNIAKDVRSDRKTKSLEQKLTHINSINKAQETTKLATDKLRAKGLNISAEVHASQQVVQQDIEKPLSKTTAYMQSLVENIVEGSAALIASFISGDFTKEALSMLAATGGASNDANKRLDAAGERAHLTDEIVKSGVDPKTDTKTLEREKGARENRMHALIDLCSKDSPTQAEVDKIEKTFQEELHAESLQKSLGSRVLQGAKNLVVDIAKSHRIHVSSEVKEGAVQRVEASHKSGEEYHKTLRDNIHTPRREPAITTPETPSVASHSHQTSLSR